MTKPDKTILDSMDFDPFGEQIAGATGTTHKFTGQERDGETGLDHFPARYYASTLGRFLSADLLAGNVLNPQSLNRYGGWPTFRMYSLAPESDINGTRFFTHQRRR